MTAQQHVRREDRSTKNMNTEHNTETNKDQKTYINTETNNTDGQTEIPEDRKKRKERTKHGITTLRTTEKQHKRKKDRQRKTERKTERHKKEHTHRKAYIAKNTTSNIKKQRKTDIHT